MFQDWSSWECRGTLREEGYSVGSFRVDYTSRLSYPQPWSSYLGFLIGRACSHSYPSVMNLSQLFLGNFHHFTDGETEVQKERAAFLGPQANLAVFSP